MKDEKDPEAPAFEIPQALQSNGYRLIPVNPKLTASLGEKAYPNLAAIGAPVDTVLVFRRSDAIEPIADEVLALPEAHRPKVFWMQTGIENAAAAKKLTAAGIDVVMDRCLKVYASKYRR
jgi:predicted CoA-binding protein